MQANITTHYLHSIIDENQELRKRVSKLSEIQQYMEALLKKCEELQMDKRQLMHQNQSMLQTNDYMKRELLNLNQNHRTQIKMVLLEHDSIMKRMHEELKIIKAEYQRETTHRDELKQDKQQLEVQLKKLQQKFQSFSKQTDRQLQQLRQSLIMNEKEYQLLAEQSKINKSQFLTQKQEMMKELYHLKAVVGRQMKRNLEDIQRQNQSLRKQNQSLKQYNEQIARRSVNRQKELSQQLKSAIKDHQLKQGLLKQQLSHLQIALSQKFQQSSHHFNASNMLIDENIHFKRQIQQCVSNQNKLCFMVQQSHKENQNLRLKIVELDTYLQGELQELKRELYDQKNHNSELRKVLSTKELMLGDKLKEIKDLLGIVDQVQAEAKMNDKQVMLLRGENQKLQVQLKMQTRMFDERSLQCRNLEDKNKYLKTSVEELQTINSSIKKQILEVETSNHSLKRQLLNPRVFSKQTEEKIQILTQNFQKERQKIHQQSRIQKQKLKHTHQFEIKQKQLQFLRKIEYFHEELQRFK